MPKRCTVCDHDRLRDIREARNSGLSLRGIAAMYGISKDALYRHFRNHEAKPGTATKECNLRTGSLRLKSPEQDKLRGYVDQARRAKQHAEEMRSLETPDKEEPAELIPEEVLKELDRERVDQVIRAIEERGVPPQYRSRIFQGTYSFAWMSTDLRDYVYEIRRRIDKWKHETNPGGRWIRRKPREPFSEEGGLWF